MTRTATKPGRAKRALDATPWSELSAGGQPVAKKKTKASANKTPLGDRSTAAAAPSSSVTPLTNKKLDTIKELKRVRKAESRRLKRIDVRFTDTTCFNCRKKGHTLSHCPKNDRQSEGTGICFKCGSQSHTSRFCKVKSKNKAQGAYPYATCFVCKKTGHISKDCPDNANGLYPNGGCCLECGSVRHLRKDCPAKQRKQGIKNYTLSTMSNEASADLEPTQDEDDEIKTSKPSPASGKHSNPAPKKVLNKRKTKLVTMS